MYTILLKKGQIEEQLNSGIDFTIYLSSIRISDISRDDIMHLLDTERTL